MATSEATQTKNGVSINADGWEYFMYSSDNSHIFDVSSGKKRRIKMSYCGEDSPLRKIYRALQAACRKAS